MILFKEALTNSLKSGKVEPMCLSGQDKVSEKQSCRVCTQTMPSEKKMPTFQRYRIGVHPPEPVLGDNLLFVNPLGDVRC